MTDEQCRMVESNHNLIYHILNKMHLPENDYYDVAAIALCKAAMSYEPERGAFSTCACKYIEWALIAQLRTEDRKIRRNEKDVLHYNAIMRDDTEYLEMFADKGVDPEDASITSVLAGQLLSELKPREKQIVIMLANGHMWREVCGTLGISNSAVGQTLKRIRSRLNVKQYTEV